MFKRMLIQKSGEGIELGYKVPTIATVKQNFGRGGFPVMKKGTNCVHSISFCRLNRIIEVLVDSFSMSQKKRT